MENKIFVESAFKSLNKVNEELCGDRVEIVHKKDGIILVLSDGLGSGVKANILSTLTSKIIATMLQNGSSIEETVHTVVHTLPVCNVRKVAYSTFSILQVSYDGNAYLVEFDNPQCMFFRNNQLNPINYTCRKMFDKIIMEARFKVEKDDLLILMSDGVVHAGLGEVLNLGLTWENALSFVEDLSPNDTTAFRIVNALSNYCEDLYLKEPGDDTTISALKIIPYKPISIFSGPPKNPYQDEEIVMDFMSNPGKKIVCGGTSANITARILGEEVTTNLDYIDPNIPPVAHIEGIDIVTEGVITLQKTLEILKEYYNNNSNSNILKILDEKHGAALIAKLLIEECTHLYLFIGQRINIAHHNPNLPFDLSAKHKILDDMYNLLKSVGKVVIRKFY